jgi:hypothetical protein
MTNVHGRIKEAIDFFDEMRFSDNSALAEFAEDVLEDYINEAIEDEETLNYALEGISEAAAEELPVEEATFIIRVVASL